jgi:hypothetical protein
LQSSLKSFNHAAVRRSAGAALSLPAISSNPRTVSHGL